MGESATIEENDILSQAVHSVIKRFVSRQSIVLDVIRDIRPDWIIRAEGRVSEKFTKTEWQNYIRQCMRIPQLGQWGNNNEWEYFLHGIGCRMKHKITGEPLDWDLGSLCTFHTMAFIYYVQWILDQDNDVAVPVIRTNLVNDEKKTLENLIVNNLEKLTDAGIVRPNQWKNKYTLLVKNFCLYLR